MSIDHYSSATAMALALEKKEISSVELTEMHIARITETDEKLNAIPVKSFDRARQEAIAADAALAKGIRAPLLGLPMTLKESAQVKDLPQTAGILPFKEYRPAADGLVAAKFADEGFCLLGKTNIPVGLGDWQANSPVYGRTNNPWDLSRTPGGSTGGGSAALAAGMTPLEVGSDLGGSVRIPAAYCGCYGHRPSESAIPKSGMFPTADLPNPTFLMGVQGPLARSATDLELLFDEMIGPDIGENAAWQLHLPKSRHDRLGDFRVALLPDTDIQASNQMRSKVDELASFLSAKGAKVEVAAPALDLNEYFLTYLQCVQLMATAGSPLEVRQAEAEKWKRVGGPLSDAMAEGMLLSAHGFLGLATKRARYQAAWRSFFKDYDVVIAPTALDSAYPHQDGPMEERTLLVDGVDVPYFASNVYFPMLAILAGLPATAFPAGLDSQGLPLGLQAFGPYLDDRTTLRFAQLLEREWHAFEKPPGY